MVWTACLDAPDVKTRTHVLTILVAFPVSGVPDGTFYAVAGQANDGLATQSADLRGSDCINLTERSGALVHRLKPLLFDLARTCRW
jgi:hypothetical protein